MHSSPFLGVIPVLEVPFDDAEHLDVDGFAAVVTHVLSTGVRSVMFPGYASEFLKLSDDERRVLRDVVLAATTDRSDVHAIVSVSDHATLHATSRAADAVEAGADAINLLPPYLLGPSPAQVHRHVCAVAAVVSPVPVILQVAPGQTGSNITPESIRRMAEERPNLRHVKVEAAPAGSLIADLLSGRPQVSALVGQAGVHLIHGLRRGAVGVQPGCSFVEIFSRMWDFWHSGDESAAERLHAAALPYLTYWMQSVELIVAAEKLISMRRGLIRTAVCRMPNYVLDEYDIRLVERFLDDFNDLLLPVVT